MTKTFNIDIDLCAITENVLTVDIFIDNIKCFNGTPTAESLSIPFEYDETKISPHVFELVVSGKRRIIDTFDDTNAAVEIKKITFDNIDVLPMVSRTSSYRHNYNDFGDLTTQEFTTFLGHDGTLKFEFFVPMLYWLTLEYPY